MAADPAIDQLAFRSLLAEIVDNRGRSCPTSDDGIALIATNCIHNDQLYPTYEKVRWVSSETYSTWFRGHPQPGDIIFVNKGTPGRVCLVPDPVDFCIAQDMVAVRADPGLIDPLYLFALLRSPVVQNQIANMYVGTLIPHFKKGDFDRLQLPVIRDRGTQEEIGRIHFEFCQKIELNRRMNETLEAMAQALFKSWFVDFDPVFDKALAAGNLIPAALADRAAQRAAVRDQYPPLPDHLLALFPDRFQDSPLGPIPEGWEASNVHDLIELIGGGTPKTKIAEYWDGDIPWFSVVDAPRDSDVFVTHTQKHVTDAGVANSSTKILPSRTTIISARGTVGKCALLGRPMAMNQSCYGIHPRGERGTSYTYYLVRNRVADLQRSGHGSVFNTITRDTFNSIPVSAPPAATTQGFDAQVEPYLAGILTNLQEAQTLSAARNILLPKLISGGLRVPDAQDLIVEATQP